MSADGEVITCEPKKPGCAVRAVWWTWGAIFIALVADLLTFAALTLWEVRTGPPPSAFAGPCLFGLSCIVGALLSRAIIRWYQDAFHWTLTNTELVGGRDGKVRFNLSSITKIVPGLPETPLLNLMLIMSLLPPCGSGAIVRRRRAFMLKFSDGTILPFNVHECTNGTPLMDALLSRCQGTVDGEYEYTWREKRHLWFPFHRWNRPIRP